MHSSTDYDHIYSYSFSYSTPKKVRQREETLCWPQKDVEDGSQYHVALFAYATTPNDGSAEELDDMWASGEITCTLEVTNDGGGKI
jgi:hypothetical protein